MKALKRRLQRGFTLFEALVVMAVGAVGIYIVAQMTDAAWDNAEYVKLSGTVPPVLTALGGWLTNQHGADCDTGGDDRYESVLGAASITAPDAKFTTNVPAGNAARQCFLMWRHLANILDFNTTTGTPAELTIGDVPIGLSITPDTGDLNAAGMKALIGEAVGTPNPAIPNCDGSLDRLAIAFPVRSMEVCWELESVMEDHRRVDSVFCHEYETAPAAIDGDAVMAICFA